MRLQAILLKMKGLIMRDKLVNIYLDYLNNYLTYERYAECNGLYISEAKTLITLAREVYNTAHPDS